MWWFSSGSVEKVAVIHCSFQDSAGTAASRCRDGRVMLASICSWGFGVACRQLEILHRAFLRVVSRVCMCALLHQTEAEYPAAEKTCS